MAAHINYVQHRAANCSAAGFVFAAMLAVVTSTHAEYPEHLIRIIIPYSAGGTTDLTVRLVAPYLSKSLGQPVVVVNRPGANGNIGTEAVVKSPADGYTLLSTASAATTNPALLRTLPYDPINDIQPVAPIAESPYAIVVNGHLPAKNVAEFIKLARSNPGKLNAAAGGGAGTRLAAELLKFRHNLSLEVISYTGTGLAALAVATGEADFAITDTASFMAFIPSGRVRVLAIAGDKRLPTMPNVPTTAEAGLPNFKSGTTVAVYVVAKTPSAVVQKLNATINAVTALQEVREQLQKQSGANALTMGVEQFTQWYRDDIRLWKEIVAKAKITPSD